MVSCFLKGDTGQISHRDCCSELSWVDLFLVEADQIGKVILFLNVSTQQKREQKVKMMDGVLERLITRRVRHHIKASLRHSSKSSMSCLILNPS
jgi:hypothetical protein